MTISPGLIGVVETSVPVTPGLVTTVVAVDARAARDPFVRLGRRGGARCSRTGHSIVLGGFQSITGLDVEDPTIIGTRNDPEDVQYRCFEGTGIRPGFRVEQ